MALPQPSLTQLRPALQLALDAAISAPPGRPLPGPVRNLVRARRLPARWAVTMVQAVNEDEGFRSWVAEGCSEDSLGRVAWLWLARPDGWAEELAGLIEEAAAAEQMDKEVRLARERAASLERELATAREELVQLRAAQANTASQFEERLRAVGRDESRRRERLESELARRQALVDELSERRSALESERDALAARVHELEAGLADSDRARAGAEERAAGLAAARDRLQQHEHHLREESETRRADVAGAVERAAAAAAALGSALAEAAGALAPPDRRHPPTARGEDRKPEGGGAASAPDVPVRKGSAARPPGRSRRRPIDLPLAVFEDSPEAAAHLVRVPGVQVLVDGYNVALTSWFEPLPDRPGVADLPALRGRLVDALGELVMRVQRTVTVVFDGVDDGGRVAVKGAARGWLRVVFSPSSVEADELIVEAVRDLPADVPVVVVSNDREVQDAARGLGANIISVGQLMSVLNRHPA